MEEKTTCFNSITLLVLKEIRLEKGIQSAHVAEQIGRSPSSWAKIENGKSSFTMDCLFQASKALWTPASAIVGAAERYATLLGQNHWAVLHTPLTSEEDHMLQAAQQYYDSPGFKRRFQPTFGHTGFNGVGISVLNSPFFYSDGSVQVIDLFRFVLDKGFSDEQKAETISLVKF